jgi:hypothetical protein
MKKSMFIVVCLLSIIACERKSSFIGGIPTPPQINAVGNWSGSYQYEDSLGMTHTVPVVLNVTDHVNSQYIDDTNVLLGNWIVNGKSARLLNSHSNGSNIYGFAETTPTNERQDYLALDFQGRVVDDRHVTLTRIRQIEEGMVISDVTNEGGVGSISR